ncbi:helix-turn-helix domain-containing protein [Aestuariicella hydrocarbonica]|uniref:Helix-turn-helix domain-containing protein n=1 Tax=Pseudomaricurvus hydrocarbonicus TaxID=1470433 RepID=A0A9E5MNY4_9GAMM|nr:helix-turn-helix domain-containing protein [Aestuariicella hydrocarbonica]NHO67673.1 helix-turn-helix domain-containing protein [Aestuariicella hydrocarbonica]
MAQIHLILEINLTSKLTSRAASHARRNFQKAMGISWEDYRLRMYAAAEQLDKTRKAIGGIAAYVGYASQPGFSRAFDATVGMGPSAYRRGKQER